jgi:hypothetical protein
MVALLSMLTFLLFLCITIEDTFESISAQPRFMQQIELEEGDLNDTPGVFKPANSGPPITLCQRMRPKIVAFSFSSKNALHTSHQACLAR